MAHSEEDPDKKPTITKGFKKTGLVFLVLTIFGFLTGGLGMGNFMVVLFLLYAIHHFWLKRVIYRFQHKTWPRVQDSYKRIITWALVGKRPVMLLLGTFVLMIVSFIITGLRKPGVVFFPQAEPNFTYIYITAPVGTSAKFTDSIVKRIENDVFTLTGKKNPVVESIISNVAVGATDPNSGDRSVAGNKGKITVAFVEFSKRGGKSTRELLEKIRKGINPIAGVDIVVEPERNGPPVGKIVNIEIRGDEFNTLVKTAGNLKTYLDNLQIPGVEELKSDFISSKPEIIVKIDRERANRQGISTAQIGMALRNSIFGAEASKFKDENEDYPIMVRVNKEQSNNLDALLNMKIIYRDMNMGGMLRQVPLSSVATVEYGNTYGGINRLNQKRVITLASNALPGYAPNEVVDQVQSAIDNFENPDGVEIIMTGEQEQQKETQSFLGMAMLASIGLIILILVTQFNSTSKPILILTAIFFSIIGVLLGFAIFDMDFSVIMTGIGVVALAGIVVRNGILLVEFTDLLRSKGVPLHEAIIEAGRTRMTPVLLTAGATILGLIPLAVGLNMDFAKLFSEFNPHIYLGGDSVAFWGPLSWTMIFGLGFSTFLTLILVPAMYLLNERWKVKILGWFGKQYNPDENTSPDALNNLEL
jgi:multidrug efflux pump subunit AcrB